MSKKKIAGIVAVSIVAIIVAIAVTAPDPVPNDEPVLEPPVNDNDVVNDVMHETQLTVTAQEENGTLVVQGTANLPDGAGIVWEAEHTEEWMDFWGDGEVTVDEGSFEFTVDISEWPAGDVEARISFNPVRPGTEAAADYEAAEETTLVAIAGPPIPDPVVYTGSGDDVLSIEPPEVGPITLHITGNEGARHFAVESYDADGQWLDLLVNTTEPYQGVVLDLGEAHELDISATGDWTIEVHPLRGATTVEIPGTIDGTGDYVFLLDGEPTIAHIIGNEAERHYAVETYNKRWDLLVNTTDFYDGRVRVESDAVIVVVTAVGPWSIEFE